MSKLSPCLGLLARVSNWRTVSAMAGTLVLLHPGLLQAQVTNQGEPATSLPQPGNVVVETEPVESPTAQPATTQGSSETTSPTTATKTRFSCQVLEGQYTVVYQPESQPGQMYAWAKPSQLGGGWTPELRCQEISRRLEFYRPDGLLEMRTAVENTYNTVCVTTQKNAECRIVLTVPPGEDPMLIRDRVFQNLTVADRGDATQAVNTFVDGGRNASSLDRLINLGASVLGDRSSSRQSAGSIHLRPFLDAADGGTGAKLQGGIHRTTPRLNPNNFR